jgi:glycosyltransferase involved in cell wall biosynthesis
MLKGIPLESAPASGLVSVVIPCFNRTGLLKEAIASCAIQTYREFEVVVVDDGSDEDLGTAIEETRTAYDLGERVRLIRQGRRGGNAARNLGLAHSRGEYIQFLDSDDLLHPLKFEVQVSQLAADPTLDMVFSLVELFERRVGDLRVLWNVSRRRDLDDHLLRFLLEDAAWSTGAPLWRRDALARLEPWDEKLSCWQDWDFHVRALTSGVKFEATEQILHYLRCHDKPRTQGIDNVAKQRDCFRAGKNAWQGLEKAGRLTQDTRELMHGYFTRHLIKFERTSGREAIRLRRDILSFLRSNSGSWKRKMALEVLGAIAASRHFVFAHAVYRAATTYGVKTDSLRDLVYVGFLPSPPPELDAIVGAEKDGSGTGSGAR